MERIDLSLLLRLGFSCSCEASPQAASGVSSDFSMSGSNVFHPRGGLHASQDQSDTGSIHQMSNAKAQAREARQRKEEEKKKVAEEWGFEKEETMAIWEARARKK